MAKTTNSQDITIPAPSRGMDTENPFIDPQSGFCRLLRNFNPNAGGIKKRNGTEKLATTFGGLTVLWFDYDTNSYLLSDGTVRDSSLGVWFASALVSGPIYSFKYRGLTFLFNGTNAPCGTRAAFPFAPATATYRGGCAFKNRPYFFDDSTLNYPALVDAVAGATVSFDLASILADEVILGAFQYSGNSGVNQDNLMAIFGSGGKVILYSGNSPSSSNWALAGVFQMSPPLNQKCLLQIDGDVVIATYEYVYSLSELIAQGASGVKKNAVSARVRRAYKQFASLGYSDQAIAYHPALDAIVFTSTSLDGLVVTTEPPT